MTLIFVNRSAGRIASMGVAFVRTSVNVTRVIDYWKPVRTFANLFANSLA